jgi:hypothetical protein
MDGKSWSSASSSFDMLPLKSFKRSAASLSNRLAWVSNVFRKPLETFRSLITRANAAMVSAACDTNIRMFPLRVDFAGIILPR